MFKSQDKVVTLKSDFLPEAAVSGPLLLQTDDITFLTFNAVQTKDSVSAGTGILEFMQCSVTKFGYPNDEALEGHPLYRRGLRPYGIFEALNSSWIRTMTKQNRVSFPNTPESKQRHFIVTFHDSTFECVAKDFIATLSTDSYEQVLSKLTQRCSVTFKDSL